MALPSPKYGSDAMIDLSSVGSIASALPMPVVIIGAGQEVLFANPAAEQFFDTSVVLL